MRGRSQPLICDRCVECSKVDRPYRLGSKHERIEPQPSPINLRSRGKATRAVETGLGFAVDAAVEQMDGGQIARVLQRGTQGENAPGTAVIVLRRPVIAVPATPAADRRQRDGLVADQGI